MKPITEDKIETFAIETLQSIGWEYIHGLAIAPGAEQSERESFEQIILIDRLRKAVSILNPGIPLDAQEQAIQKVLRIYSPELLYNNETFHQLLVEKVKIPYQIQNRDTILPNLMSGEVRVKVTEMKKNE